MNRLLIIDDDYAICRTLKLHFDRRGFDVETHQSADDGFAALCASPADIVISDIRMPHMNGVETINVMIERCKEKERQAPPFIFITGYADEEVNQRAQDLDPAEFIVKPFNQIDFLGSVKAALGV